MKLNLRSQPDPRALEWTAEALERTTADRLEAERRLTAAIDAELSGADPAADVLGAIEQGETDGPHPALAHSYRREREREMQLERVLSELLQEHPAWPWLRQVPGVNAVEAGRLLSRLDVRRAPTPSAFWAYCGLATVPAARVRCAICGAERVVPAGAGASSRHVTAGEESACSGRMEPIADDAEARMAQPRSGSRDGRRFDQEAKRICFSIGSDLRSAGHQYETYYRHQRETLDSSRPDWERGRKHVTALRKMQKLFLAHLWLVWREAVDLPLTEPAPAARADGRWLSPWSMTSTERRRWSSRDRSLPPLRDRGGPTGPR